MNPGPTVRTLILCNTLLLSAYALTAQVADLPIKPGLWNTQVVLKMGADDKDTQPISQQACFTAGSTISGYLTAITKSHPDIKCTVASKVQTGHRLVFDTVCTSPTISSKAHHDFNLTDPDHFSGSSHTAMTGSIFCLVGPAPQQSKARRIKWHRRNDRYRLFSALASPSLQAPPLEQISSP